MSIRARLEDAIILDNMGRKDGALLSLCVAVAATSRLRFPRTTTLSRWKPNEKMGDKEAFQTFVKEESESIYGAGLRLDLGSPCPDPENPNEPPQSVRHREILYKYVRSELVHFGQLPATIAFEKRTDGSLFAGYRKEENRFIFSDTWLSSLFRAVIYAQEHDGSFEKERKTGEIWVTQSLPFTVAKPDLEKMLNMLGSTGQALDADFPSSFRFTFRDPRRDLLKNKQNAKS